MTDFNDIGISRELDLPRIKKLLSCAWIAFGNLWMFGGLLAVLPKVQKD